MGSSCHICSQIYLSTEVAAAFGGGGWWELNQLFPSSVRFGCCCSCDWAHKEKGKLQLAEELPTSRNGKNTCSEGICSQSQAYIYSSEGRIKPWNCIKSSLFPPSEVVGQSFKPHVFTVNNDLGWWSVVVPLVACVVAVVPVVAHSRYGQKQGTLNLRPCG